MREIVSPLDGLRGPFSVRRGFSPSTLFALAEPGVWYDPSDVANLAWRRNLLTWTEQFENAAWTKRSSTASGGVITASAGPGDHTVTQQPATSGATVTASVRARPGTSSFIYLTLSPTYGLSNYATVVADVATGQVTKTQSGGTLTGATAGISGPDAQGFYRLTLSAANPTTSIAIVVGISNSATPTIGGYGNVDFTATGTETIITGGAQLELGSTATDYQRISDVNTEVIERFPTATLFQDTAGTQPVTTPGQTVALALDKSKGLVLGSEIVTNGTFDSGITGWTNFVSSRATVSWNSTLQRLRVDNTTGTGDGYVWANTSVTAGRTYRVTLNYFPPNPVIPGKLQFYWFNGTSTVGPIAQVDPVGSLVSFVTTAPAGANSILIGSTLSTSVWELDNVSVRELPGFHATQATAASRPTYGIVPRTGRRNLLTYSEQFDNAVWTKTNTTISADSNATTDPLGGSSADALFETTANGFHSILPASAVIAAVSGQSYTFSFYLKANGRTKGFMSVVNGADFTTFDLTAKTNVFGGNGTNVTVTAQTITELPNGWFRLTSSVAISGSVNIRPVVGINNDSNVSSYAGDATKGFYLWGAQLETGSTATAYQRVGSAFDVTEAGVASLSYLFFGGEGPPNDARWLVTPTITPGTDKVQVFAGVRKLSDAALGVIAEPSVDWNSNAGTFLFNTGTSSLGAPNYSSGARGTALASIGQFGVSAASFSAPITNVVTAIHDIAGDISAIRVNGAASGTNGTVDKGAGNFLAYPIYIGRRGGTTLGFNGQIFSLIVRFGTNLDAGTITSTETWVAGKTGVTL